MSGTANIVKLKSKINKRYLIRINKTFQLKLLFQCLNSIFEVFKRTDHSKARHCQYGAKKLIMNQ